VSAADFMRSEIEPLLQRIGNILPAAYNVTLIARHTQMSVGKNADIILTVDDLPAVIDAIERLMPSADQQYSAQAVIERGEIVIRVPVANLGAVVEGSWAAGGMDTRFKVTNTDEFARELVTELNREDDAGTTRIHKMFDAAIDEAINQGALGIEEHEEQER
jgi:hypothetical protein